MVLKQLVVFADSDVSLRLKTVADQAATSSITVSLVPLRIRRSTFRAHGLTPMCEEYEAKHPMTPAEKQALRKWVASGHSVATGCNRTQDRHSRENRPLKKGIQTGGK